MADVLILDESLTVRMDLKQALEAAGHSTVLCGTIQTAREQLAAGKLGLMILDVLLPDGDGVAFLRQVRSDPATASMPVMLLSSQAEAPRDLLIGDDNCVGKPYDRSYVVARAGELLRAGGGQQAADGGRPAARRIMAVDDSPTYLHELSEQLRRDGIEVVMARCGEECLRLLAGRAVDCILLDLVMPGMSGQETCRRIKDAPAWRNIPVLMLTGTEDPQALIASFNAGADDFIAKSSEFSVLRARLRVQLRRKQFEEENQRIREQLQQKEVEAKAAEIASQAKDHFLAVLSHELRTPLTPVLATASLLECTPGLSADVRQSLEVIRRNVELEARLIDDLLDVTRISRGKVELDKRPVELCMVIRRAVEVCQPDIEARQLHFGVDLGDARDVVVEADAARLQQVFWNLLKNSIKFTPPGGCVGIRVRELPVASCQCPEGRDSLATNNWQLATPSFVVVEVNDSGAGIEPAALDRIFNAFEQAERSITRQFGGLGLGLTISKAMVEMHGGTISAHSEGRNKGASFRVRLPILSGPASRPLGPGTKQPGTLVPEPGAPTFRILLVEDHGDTARIMKRLLAASGHQVETAGDVATALALAETQRFDLLISDLGLPDGTGVELMQKLRRRAIAVPGIALSGYGREEDVQRSKAAGFAEHLTKPVDFERLRAAIARVAERPG